MNVINESANANPSSNPSGSTAKNPLALAPQKSVATASLVLIDCGEFNLLLPGDEIISLAPATELIDSQSSQNCGYVEFEQHCYPVFCLNKPLQLQSELLASHKVIVLLEHIDYRFGISCCELTKVSDLSRALSMLQENKMIFYKVPVCMTSRKQPFSEFAIINNQAAGLSSAAALFSLLQLRGATLSSLQTVPTKMFQGAS
jgi:hypothetical protein